MARDASCAFVGARRLRTVRDGPEIVPRSDRTYRASDDLGRGSWPELFRADRGKAVCTTLNRSAPGSPEMPRRAPPPRTVWGIEGHPRASMTAASRSGPPRSASGCSASSRGSGACSTAEIPLLRSRGWRPAEAGSAAFTEPGPFPSYVQHGQSPRASPRPRGLDRACEPFWAARHDPKPERTRRPMSWCFGLLRSSLLAWSVPGPTGRDPGVNSMSVEVPGRARPARPALSVQERAGR